MRRSPTTSRLVAALLLAAWSTAAITPAAEPDPERQTGELVVGTVISPPFVMRDAGGGWSGLAIDLWREVARRENLTYRLEERELEPLLADVENGRIDVAVGPLLITAERARRIDLTSPFMHIALAVGTRPETGRWPLLASLPRQLLWATLGLAGLLLVFAFLVWLLERHRNPEHFGGARMRGLGDAIWWSASTMSTVGYGDRTPVTFWGRMVGIVWMFSAILLVSGFIALVTSAVTVRQLQSQIRSIADLARVRVGTVEASGSAEYLRDAGIASLPCESVGACLDALVAGEIDVVVEEWPVLNWEARHRYPGRIAIVPQPFTRGFIAFGLPRDSARRRSLDVTLLEVLDAPVWKEISRSYLGVGDRELAGTLSAHAP